MAFTAYTTLTEACDAARGRPRHTIALILGVEGARYYMITSTPTLGTTKPYVTDEVTQDQSAHAEMHLICDWTAIMRDFRQHRSSHPRRAEIFLSHTPCRDADDRPSPAMRIGGTTYSRSCRSKLYSFFRHMSDIKWKIWYWERFASAAPLDAAALRAAFPGIEIERMVDENNYGNPLPRITR